MFSRGPDLAGPARDDLRDGCLERGGMLGSGREQEEDV
jgi:hypothetical protein